MVIVGAQIGQIIAAARAELAEIRIPFAGNRGEAVFAKIEAKVEDAIRRKSGSEDGERRVELPNPITRLQ